MLNNITSIIIIFFLFLYPIFFLPFTTDAYEFNKMILLYLFCIILFILYILKIVLERKLTVVSLPFFFPLLFLAVITSVSAFFQSPNIISSLITPSGTGTILAVFFLYLFLGNLITENFRERSLVALVIGSNFICLYILAQFLKIIPASVSTPAGSLLFTAVFLTITAFYLLSAIIQKFRSRRNTDSEKIDNVFIYQFISILLHITSIIYLIIHLSTDQKVVLLPFDFGLLIALEIIKNAKTLFLGVGSGNFITAFTLAKPIAINQSPVWNIIFTSSSSFLLTLITESGLISGVLYLFILCKSAILFLKSRGNPVTSALLTVLVLLCLVPINMTVIITAVILLALAPKHKNTAEFDLSGIGIITYVFLIPTLVFSGFFIYLIGRSYAAEIYFKKSIDSAGANRGNDLYQYQVKAISLNPYMDRYHIAFSQTNLTLANALAQKKALTDEDKNNIPRLIQQAIDQAKIAAALNRTNVINWDNLAKTYSSLITFAKDSDKWAIQSYQQRAQLDPVNPNSYLSLGGIYLTLNRYQEAEKEFRTAVSLKYDYASAHYNLAMALSGENKKDEAQRELTIAQSFTTPGSDDARKIQEAMEDLK